MIGDQVATQYDFIVCGSGSSGSVVARRLAENTDVTVLLLEAGGSDAVPEVIDVAGWQSNVGTERDWRFVAQPNPYLNGRSIPLSMGKVLGGGSSINVTCWARGHKSDWDFFADEAGDQSWSYEAVLNIYRRMEDWHGMPDPCYRGIGGPAFVQPVPKPHPLAVAAVKGAESVGIPSYMSNNGAMMEGVAGAAIQDVRARNGQRQSAFRSYVGPILDRKNLNVVTDALVVRLVLKGNRAIGVEFAHNGATTLVKASREVIVSLGAIHTPKLLLQSGIGDAEELRKFDIPVIQHLPGVGRNYQDHPLIPCVWECSERMLPRNCGSEATIFFRSDSALNAPDLQICVVEFPLYGDHVANAFDIAENGWTMALAVVRPQSQGRVRLTGRQPTDPVSIEANVLSHPDDLKAAVAGVDLCRHAPASGVFHRATCPSTHLKQGALCVRPG